MTVVAAVLFFTFLFALLMVVTVAFVSVIQYHLTERRNRQTNKVDPPADGVA